MKEELVEMLYKKSFMYSEEGGLEAVQAEAPSVQSIVTVEDLMAHSEVRRDLN